MNYSELICEYGIVGMLSTIVMMFGDELGITWTQPSNESESSDGSASECGLSYIEIKEQADSMACQLFYRYGIRAGQSILVVCKGNPVAEIISCLACATINAPFVPIDLKWLNDPTKLSGIIHDSHAVAAIVVANSDEDHAVQLLGTLGIHRSLQVTEFGLLNISTSSCDIRSDLDTMEPHSPPPNYISYLTDVVNSGATTLFSPLYILYTSGSTGTPKGVVGTHEGLINRLAWQYRSFPCEGDDVVCRRTPLIFVDSMVEIFGPILSATPIWIPPPELMQAQGLIGIAAAANEAGVTRITVLPSQMMSALKMMPDLGAVWPVLRHTFVSGEACSRELVTAFSQACPDAVLVNLYGSTEVAGDVSYAVLTGRESEANTSSSSCHGQDTLVPIGCAISNNILLVVGSSGEGVNRSFTLQPDGQAGELVVLGNHVALGYQAVLSKDSAQIDRSMNRFLNIPLDLVTGLVSESQPHMTTTVLLPLKMFVTGDVVVRCPVNKQLYWLGRTDRQVKIRGIRLELEEAERLIATALASCPLFACDHALTMIAWSPEDHLEDRNYLILVLECPGVNLNDAANMKQLKTHLASSVAELYMPAVILPITALPRTIAGKIDRRTLMETIKPLLQPTDSKAVTVASGATTGTSDSLTPTIIIITQIVNAIIPMQIPNTCEPMLMSFSELGGDSMNCIEFLWRLQHAFTALDKKFWSNLTAHDLRNSALSILASLVDVALALSQHDLLDNSKSWATKRPLGQDSDDDSHSNKTAKHFHVTKTDKIQEILNDSKEFTSAVWQGKGSSGTLAVSLSSFGNGAITLKPVSQVQLLRCVDSSPLVVMTSPHYCLVYTGSHGGDFVCARVSLLRDHSPLELVWTASLGKFRHIEASAACSHCGARVFVTAFSGNDVDGLTAGDNNTAESPYGCVFALSAVTGDLLWQQTLPAEIKSTPTVCTQQQLLLVTCYDGCLYCLDEMSGELCGRCDFDCGPLFAPPVILARDTSSLSLLVTSIRGAVISCVVTRDLNSKSTCQFTQNWFRDIQAPIYGTARQLELSSGCRCVVVGSVDGWLRCIRLETGDIVWHTLATRPIFSTSTVVTLNDAPVVIFGSHDGMLRCVNGEDGILLCEADMESVLFASPSVVRYDNNKLHNINDGNGLDNNIMIIAATTAGDVIVSRLSCADTGRGAVMTAPTIDLLSKHRLYGEIYSSPVCMGSNIYVGCRDDCLHQLEIVCDND